MIRHIKNKHKDELDALSASGSVKSFPPITSYVTKSTEWKRDGKRMLEWQRKIVKFVVDTNQPLSVFENKYFRDLLPKDFVAPCRKTFKNVCLETCYQETKDKLLFDIRSHTSKYIGIQVDHTTASNHDPYCSLCIQFINDDFSLRSISIGMFEYREKHTSDAL